MHFEHFVNFKYIWQGFKNWDHKSAVWHVGHDSQCSKLIPILCKHAPVEKRILAARSSSKQIPAISVKWWKCYTCKMKTSYWYRDKYENQSTESTIKVSVFNLYKHMYKFSQCIVS